MDYGTVAEPTGRFQFSVRFGRAGHSFNSGDIKVHAVAKDSALTVCGQPREKFDRSGFRWHELPKFFVRCSDCESALGLD